MKILFVHHVSDLYGASRSLLRLAARLAQDGNEVEVLVPEQGPLCSALRAAGVRVELHPDLPVLRRRNLRPPFGPLRLMVQTVRSSVWLVRRLRTNRPDLVHTNSAVMPSVGLAARWCGIPHLWHVRELLRGESALWPVYQWYMALLADRILCISEAVGRQFCAAVRRRNIRILDNGIPEREVTDAPLEQVEAIRRRLGLSGALSIGVAGRIQLDQKGQDIFIRAAAELVREFPDTVFVIAGSPYPGNERHEQRLRELVRELGLEERVRLLGQCQQMAAVYASVDIWVLPAKKPEGLGNVLLEAMAMGKPVVGSAIGGIPEIILDGQNGFLAPPGNAGALAAALRRLLRDPELRRRMGEAGRRRFLERFEFEACYRKILAAYHSVSGPGAAGVRARRAAGEPFPSSAQTP